VSKLGTCFASPEETIMKQNEDSDAMYFITQGDCTVDITDEEKVHHVAIKLLVEGQHFGEIGVVFNTKRTATVISRNYNTMAKLSKEHYKDVVGSYPEYDQALMKHVYKYQDSRKKFIWKMFQQIEYFKNKMDYPLFHRLMYTLKTQYMEKGEILLKEKDDTDNLFLIEQGCLEVFTMFEGNEFVIDRLPKGSCIGHRVVFTEDQMIVNIRAKEPSYVSRLHEKDFEEI